MDILIIEDEQEAADRLKRLLHAYDAHINVLGVIDTVEDAVEWFQSHPAPDLVCLDIHLADGLCFDIFDHVLPEAPVIFTTAYDQYAIQAFKLDSIDYLLKPVEGEELAKAMGKYLNRTTSAPVKQDLERIAALLRPKQYKTRFMVRSGNKQKILASSEVAYFTAEEKQVYLVDIKNQRYVVPVTLDELEKVLDPSQFFRINRSEIIRLEAIDFMEPYFNGREVLVLKIPDRPKLFVSRRRVAALKKAI